MFWPIVARGPWPETFKTSLSRANLTANKRRRQAKGVKIFLNFTYLHKMQPGPENFQDESLGGRVDLGTSSQVITFRARYSLNFRPISNCREQAISAKSKKKR